jgi:hypothetical protein
MLESRFADEGIWFRRGSTFVLRAAGLQEAEDEVPRTVNARVKWEGPMDIVRARQQKGGGLYFIRAADRPCYVGQTVSFADRLAAHLRSGRCTYAPPHLWKVWIGRVEDVGAAVPGGPDAERRLRLGVEHAVIRSVINQQNAGPKGTLLNRSSIRPFLVQGVLRVENSGDIPRIGLSKSSTKGLGVPNPIRKGSWKTVVESRRGTLYEWQP